MSVKLMLYYTERYVIFSCIFSFFLALRHDCPVCLKVLHASEQDMDCDL